MLKIRLQRRGKNNYATFRVVIAEHHAPIKGRFIADIGSYNPHTDAFTVTKEDATKWISQGAQPSATVHNLMVTHKLIDAPKRTIWRPPAVPATPAESAAAPAEPATPEATETPAA